MSCPDHTLLASFAEGGLSDTERNQIQLHIDDCPDCFQTIVALAHLTSRDSDSESHVFAHDETMASMNEILPPPRRNYDRMAPMGTMVGRTLDGRYLMGDLIGRGGFAEVYRATQLSVGRAVAIKVLTAQLSSQPELMNRFESEAKIISRLKHPNILKLIDFGTTSDDRLYIVVELLEGLCVDEVLTEGPQDQRRMAAWTQQICGALQEAHSEGIYHRDLKPSNLFLEIIGGQDFVKILDFGIAKIADTKQTTSGVIMGTPSYMSPEQIEARDIDHRTDLYSLGVILFEALTGQPPFQGNTPVMVMYKHAKQDAPPVETLVDTVHPAMAYLVAALLRKDPAMRPSHASAVVRYIQDIDWTSHDIPELPTESLNGSIPHETAKDEVSVPATRMNGTDNTTQEDSPPLVPHISDQSLFAGHAETSHPPKMSEASNATTHSVQRPTRTALWVVLASFLSAGVVWVVVSQPTDDSANERAYASVSPAPTQVSPREPRIHTAPVHAEAPSVAGDLAHVVGADAASPIEPRKAVNDATSNTTRTTSNATVSKSVSKDGGTLSDSPPPTRTPRTQGQRSESNATQTPTAIHAGRKTAKRLTKAARDSQKTRKPIAQIRKVQQPQGTQNPEPRSQKKSAHSASIHGLKIKVSGPPLKDPATPYRLEYSATDKDGQRVDQPVSVKWSIKPPHAGVIDGGVRVVFTNTEKRVMLTGCVDDGRLCKSVKVALDLDE